ncbi:MAG: recombination protein RecR [Chthonomonas sp.]|nr:recombination protein RecR [Chthonomonas sp.]
MLFAKPLGDLISQLEKLPGIGPKSAQRLAFYLVRQPEDDVRMLSESLVRAKQALRFCERCQNMSELALCSICSDAKRDQTTICVVAEPRDVAAVERINEYHGTYHVLHGLMSPMDGIGPENLKVRELLARLGGEMAEVIVATNPTIEGDATALYLAKLLKPTGVKVTRLAYGMPVGGELDYADSATLHSALEYRREL